MLKKLYLVLFNLISGLGWATVLVMAVKSLLQGDAPAEFWAKWGYTLNVVQSLACLEIVHSLFRIVRSPIATALPQVLSRVGLLWIYTDRFVGNQAHWSVYLFTISWCCAEVPRYTFYTLKQFGDKAVPKFLTVIRYSGFICLYPTGITGELVQQITAMKAMAAQGRLVHFYFSLALVLAYVPLSPYLYMHMVKQRKKVLGGKGKRRKRGPRKIDGIEYPITDAKKNKRSTLAFNKSTWEASVKGIDQKEFEKIQKVKNWRFGYKKHVLENVRITAKDVKVCMKVANQGLDFVHNSFLFFRNGEEYKLQEAMDKFGDNKMFTTGIIKGEKPKPEKIDYEVPYKGKILKKEVLLKKLEQWANYGTIEPDCREAIANVVNHPEWCDLSDKYFVLLGASSAMGPIQVLVALGANIIAVDIDRAHIWERLVKMVKNSHATMYFPTKVAQSEFKSDEDVFKNAGCNLLTETPEISQWLVNLLPEKKLVIGGYAYLDGALFLKISACMDAIIKKCCEKRKNKNAGMAFLCSPTDAFVIPKAAYLAQKKNYKKAPLWQKVLAKLGGKRVPRLNFKKADAFKDVDGKEVYVTSGVVSMQGPNYALAKRIQHWRVMRERMNGHFASSNIAPSTRTASVVSNKKFEMGYAGLHLFKPMEVMYQETSNAVCSALLINDVCNPKSVSQPGVKFESGNPQEIMRNGAFHGGIWRTGFEFDSCGTSSAMYWILKHYGLKLALGLSTVVGLTTYSVMNPPHNWFM